MRDYIKIPRNIWHNREFSRLSTEAQTTFFALLSGDAGRDFMIEAGVDELRAKGVMADIIGEFRLEKTFGCVAVPAGRMTGIARKWIATAIRLSVYARDGFACVYCGDRNRLTLDHVVAVSRGGTDNAENLVTACKSCNSSKGAKALDEWRTA